MIPRWSKLACAICATICCALPVAAQNGEPYYATIAAERIATANGSLPETIRATLHIKDSERAAAILGEIEGIDVVDQTAGTVDVIFDSQPIMPGVPDQRYLGNSFVIDFDEPSVRELADEIAGKQDATPTIEQLTDHVFTHIDDKTYSRAFDLASRVASSGAGDCTEHAVLLVALARSQGYPARVVLGTVLIDIANETRAYGHAWAEIHNGNNWQIADATQPDYESEVLKARYLPDSLLDNEGPGYALALMNSATLTPARISNIGPAE